MDGNYNGTGSTYSFSYGAVGSSMTTISGLALFAGTIVTTGTTANEITNFGFAGNNSASNYGVDNVFLSAAVPESDSTWFAAGACVLVVAWKARKALRCA